MPVASKIAAKAAGKAKAAVKALSGYSGIFRHLAGEHGQVSAMMQRVAMTSSDSSVREELFPEIYVSLLAHAKAEEKVFYPALRKIAATKSLVPEAVADHKKVEEYLEELSSKNKGTKTWLTIFERMMRAVESHVAEEENEIFPAAQEALSTEQSNDLLEEYEKVEQKLKEKLAA